MQRAPDRSLRKNAVKAIGLGIALGFPASIFALSGVLLSAWAKRRK